MEKESNKKKTKKEKIVELYEKFINWTIKREQKKEAKELKREEKWGKYRLIKNKKLRSIVWLLILIAYVVIIYYWAK